MQIRTPRLVESQVGPERIGQTDNQNLTLMSLQEMLRGLHYQYNTRKVPGTDSDVPDDEPDDILFHRYLRYLFHHDMRMIAECLYVEQIIRTEHNEEMSYRRIFKAVNVGFGIRFSLHCS